MVPPKFLWLLPAALVACCPGVRIAPVNALRHVAFVTEPQRLRTTSSTSPLDTGRGPCPLAASQEEAQPVPPAPNADFSVSRRSAVLRTTGAAALLGAASISSLVLPSAARAAEAPPFVQEYDDFKKTDEGWSYKDVKVGAGGGNGKISNGDRVVFDWSGYTIGYFGRPFEAKGGPKGGAFDKELDFSRTIIGSSTIVPGLECALRTMKPGGIRQVIVPYGPLSYPPGDKDHLQVGPKPTTFSGMRALDFVLENPRVDRTLLFNVKLIRLDRSDGKGGFVRGEKNV